MQLSVIVGSTTYSLTDGNPYSLESATGLGIAPVQRRMSDYIGAAGAIDYGYTLRERIVTLALLFEADSDAQLDGYRNNLQRVFAPGTNAPLVLRVVRDDGEERRLDVVASGLGFLALDAENRPGHLHRCVVQLRAAEPTWYGTMLGTVFFGFPFGSAWYRGSNSIDAGWPNAVYEYPSVGASWSSTFPHYSCAFRGTISTSESIGATLCYIGSDRKVVMGTTAIGSPALFFEFGSVKTQIMECDDREHSISITWFLTSAVIWVDRVQVANFNMFPESYPLPTSGGWRADSAGSNTWNSDLRYASNYIGPLSAAELLRLNEHMGGTVYNYHTSGTVAIAPDSEEDYPDILIGGYVADPYLVNSTTAGTIDFTGATVHTGEIYRMDLRRNGAIAFVSDSGQVLSSPTLDGTALPGWFLQPGTANIILGTASKIDRSGSIQISYRDRYTGV